MDYLGCKSYFDYYLSLEKECLETEYYVAFHENNSKAFSIAYAKILLSLCSEIETVLKKICFEIDPTGKHRNTSEYRRCVDSKYKFFAFETVSFSDIRIKTNPWIAWSEGKSPKWWLDFTEIKHKRADADATGIPNFYRANQDNVLNALTALYVAEQYLFYTCEQKYKYTTNNMSFVLQNLSSKSLLMSDWRKCYLFFQGSYWVDLNALNMIMISRE